jgi:ribonuclease HI
MSNTRRYVPSEIWGDRLHSEKFEKHEINDFMLAPCPCCELCSHCDFHKPITNGIIVAVDGACRNNGRSDARAAYGVYFNIDSRFNRAGLLDKGPMTNQRAEITAAFEACKMCLRMLNTPDFFQKIGQIVIKSDSTYLVNSMVTYVEKWRLNNYTSSRGRPVVNADLLRGLDEIVVWLEEEEGVDVRFWHVPRAQNKQADKLANAALDGVDYKKFTRDDLFD